jgi:hypothetical protein
MAIELVVEVFHRYVTLGHLLIDGISQTSAELCRLVEFNYALSEDERFVQRLQFEDQCPTFSRVCVVVQCLDYPDNETSSSEYVIERTDCKGDYWHEGTDRVTNYHSHL